MADSVQDDLPFEKPLRELKQRIKELRRSTDSAPGLENLLTTMQQQSEQAEAQLYDNLSAWNTVQIARHARRPQTRDYIEMAFDEFVELHGDRSFHDDPAIVTGLGRIDGHRVMLVGQHKGRNVKERHLCRAGCPQPEGYWKALRKMQLAERLGIPIVCLIDTMGAFPGIESEERGVAIAIAENMMAMSCLRVPVICCVIGEGGSGGALGICVGDRMLMLQYSYFTVISPEGCAAILWRDREKKAHAAAALKLTSRDLRDFGLIDEIVQEPLGGGHRDRKTMATLLREAVVRNLNELKAVPIDELVAMRQEKYRHFGEWLEGQSLPAAEETLPAPEPESEEAGARMSVAGHDSDTGPTEDLPESADSPDKDEA